MTLVSQQISSDKNSERDYAFVIRLTCLAIAMTLIMEWRNFLPEFRHPLLTYIPLYEPLAKLPFSFNWEILIACFALLGWLFIAPFQRIPALGISACILFWGIQDIMLFQPWFHMYCFVALVAALCKQPQNGLNALRIMICGVYFWAGFHKLNATFFTHIMPWVLAPIYYPDYDWLYQLAAYFTPIFEASIGILLLFHRWRFVASAMALTMLIVVFTCLGPFGHNWGQAIPLWNIWLFLMELRLFLSPAYDQNVSLLNFKWDKLSLASIAMFIVAPVLAIFIPGYARLGFKLFSGNTLTAKVILAPGEAFAGKPELFRGMVKKKHQLSFKIPIYHSEYAYRMRAKTISPYLDYPNKAKLRIYSPPPFYSTKKEYRDYDLLTPN